MKYIKHTRQKGFTLIEILLVIGILMGMVMVEMRKQMDANDEQVAVAAGRQVAELGKAVDKYIGLRATALQAGTDPNCTVVQAGVCDLRMDALRNQGFLPPSADEPANANAPVRAPWDAPYIVRIRQIAPPLPAQAALVCGASTGVQMLGCPVPYPGGAVPAYQIRLQGLIISQTRWDDQGASGIRWTSLGRAAREAGPMAGVSQGAQVVGFNGGWTATAADFGAIINDGQMAYFIGTSNGNWDRFLRRDGSNPMTGNLNVGGFDITNMQDLFLNGPPNHRRNKNLSSLMPNWVFKGVYSAPDGQTIPKPVCQSLGGTGQQGVPKIKLLMTTMAPGPDVIGAYDNGSGAIVATPDQPVADGQVAANKAQSAWYIYAVDTGTDWTTHFERTMDDSGTPVVYKGGGLAEVYCLYEDQ